MVNFYLTYFIVISFVGYIYECIAMTLWSGKWDNRGFLYGPVIPIYGFGAVLGTLLFEYVITDYNPTIVFVTGFIASIILEFPTSVILEKCFHAYWWDYSSAPFNIQGRVSLFSSLGFGVAALIIVYAINPVLVPIIGSIKPLALEFISAILLMLITADFTLTVSVLANFEAKVNNLQSIIDERLSEQVENLNPKERSIKGAIKYTKANIVDAGVDKMVSTLDGFYHGAISRIKGFRNSGSDSVQALKNGIKERVDKLRGKNER